MSIEDIIENSGALPAAEIVKEVNSALERANSLVVTAPPGAGKSTLLPLTILKGLADGGKVLVLEPRRIAARQIAERMASILGEPIGRTVGYRVRFERKVSADTRIEVLTEGILTRMLVSDPTLDGVSVVIFDEFHERNINSDLALALTRQAQNIIRPDLKIIIMSATIDTNEICHHLDAPLIESRGRMFHVDVKYADKDYKREDLVSAVIATVRYAHATHDGDILVFLPGQGEIMRCEEKLSDTLGATNVYPLYGNLSPEMQRRAIAPSRQGERKVVLATPIAETSLTIEGVRIVVDSGLCRALVFDPRTGLSHLETVRITKDMAVQRMGRAGRVAEGVCYKLWTKHSEHTMADQRNPEILDADLASLVLDVSAFDEADIESLPWLTMPQRANIYKAKDLLVNLGAMTNDGVVTELGKRMSQMPCHPRISRMILKANNADMQALACDIAALLEEKDPMCDSADTDISLRISELRRLRSRHSLGRWTRIAHIADEYRRLTRVSVCDNDALPDDVGTLVGFAYPERIAVATDDIGHYRLASGDNVRLDMSDAMSAYKWIAVASLNVSANGGKVFLSAPIPDMAVEELSKERVNLSWSSRDLRVVAQKEKMIGKILISSRPIHDVDRDAIINIICDAVKKDGLSMFDWNEDVQRLQRRISKASEWHPEWNIPDFSTSSLMERAEEWLPFYLDDNGKLLTSAIELKKIDLVAALWAIVPYELQREIDRVAPSHILVPSGRRIRIDYRIGAAAPVVSVRLQECFGMEDTPCIDDGRQPLLMELLSPGFKPVQLTQDLRSFWQTTYFEVRKELKRRYPKHNWPEKV